MKNNLTKAQQKLLCKIAGIGELLFVYESFRLYERGRSFYKALVNRRSVQKLIDHGLIEKTHEDIVFREYFAHPKGDKYSITAKGKEIVNNLIQTK